LDRDQAPKVVLVSAQAAHYDGGAWGPRRLAHSASRIASASLGAMTPGAPQLLRAVREARSVDLREGSGGVAGEAESLAKELQSEALRRRVFNEHDGLAWPEMPPLKRGFKS